MMMAGWERWVFIEPPLLVLTAISTHLVISGGQTVMHYRLGHRRLGGIFFRNHINFHHRYYAKGHLASASYQGAEGNNTPYFLAPIAILGTGLFFILPLDVFVVMALAAAASFYAHVYLDKEYHVEPSRLARFGWFRRKQRLHFVHHLHATSNFAVIDFFWDRLLGTYREPDEDVG